ncbi:hypothetical protein Ahy_A05g025782 isoform G [Arachis hypogaea]|uniref:Uncharacterized protein n=1 Tax=Arachis hypogaea TaxID=3818 RepID=A0A445D9D7_ARAHY|nr:hypothetical protein Ahy_A05g025782 isoform G [Arachis hypogaea]
MKVVKVAVTRTPLSTYDATLCSTLFTWRGLYSSCHSYCEDINMSISHAADSIGLKEIPRYEVKIIEEDDWMKGAQLLNLLRSLLSILIRGMITYSYYGKLTYVRYEFECLPGYMKGLATWERLRAIYELGWEIEPLDLLNSPTTFEMPLEVLGHELQFTQDPNSKHLGTKVWDSSLVFAKFLERNCRKGRFSPAKLKGKRVIELGAGYGVSSFGNVTNDF